MDTPGHHSGDLIGGVDPSDQRAPDEEYISDTDSDATIRPLSLGQDSVDDFLYDLDEGTEPSLGPVASEDTSSVMAPSFNGRLSRWLSRTTATFSDASSIITSAIHSHSSHITNTTAFASAGSFYSKHLDCPRPYRTYSVQELCASLLKSNHVDDAKIVSVERYGDLEGVPHRFLILHIVRRADERDFYLRLDRRRDHTVPLLTFATRDRGRSAAVDTAALSGQREHLLDYTNTESGEEAIMDFLIPAPLTAVVRILDAIAKESPAYNLRNENCWFFVSTVQEMLVLGFGAQYQRGSLNHPNIGSDRRKPIRRLTYSRIADEIKSRSKTIMKFTALVADSKLTGVVGSVLNAIQDRWKSVSDISSPDAPQIASSTRELLITLHQTLHEHLHACYGVRGARVISSSFSVELLQVFQAWERSHPTSSRRAAARVDGMISLTTSVTNLVKSSLRGDRPMNRYSSITYDPIGDDLSSFSNPLPTLLRQVVLSVRTEIDTGSESILKLTTLIGDPRVSGAVESVLNALKKCYKSVDHIFGAPDAPQILSSTRGLLTALHQALHEHLHACHGVQRARIISSSFFEELPKVFMSWGQVVQTSSQNAVSSVEGISTLASSITNLLQSSLKGNPNRNSSITYDPIGNDPGLFSKPLPKLIHKVIQSVRNEIDTSSESILKLITLIGDSKIAGTVESVLDAMKNCYELADHIFCAPDAPQILSSTRGLLSTLHRALHEHLHACRGIQGARNISSRFPDELPRIFLSREWSIETSSHVTASRVDRMITLMTSVTDLLESSLKGDPPGQQSSTAYDPIGSDPRSFSKQLPTLIREVVLSMPNEIASKSESILKLTPLIGDSRVTGAAKSVLNAIKDCYKLADHIFCAPGALQILSSTRRLLSTLHQALHEHLHACYGIQGARIISSNFSEELPRIFLSWRQRVQTSPLSTTSRVEGMAIRITSITTLLESSLQGNPPVNQEPSITYDPIGDNPSSFSKPFPILIHKVVLSVLNEIDSGSESISQFTALIEDSRISRAVESVLNAIKICYKSADHIFCSPDAPRILSSTRELLSMLRQALHEHLHACHGSQGARTISSSFSRELPRILLSWERGVETSSHMDGMITLMISVANLLESSLKGASLERRHSSIIYKPIDNDAGSFSKQFPTLICKVVLSMPDEINSKSDSIMRLTALMEASRVAEAIEPILNAIKHCYKSVDHILCAPDAPQILLSTRRLLSVLHQALHEHLHARYGIRGARTISNSFSEELPQILSSWERSVRTSLQNARSPIDGITTLITSITNLLESSLKGDPPVRRHSANTYDPIGDDPNSFSEPLQTLMRKVVLSVLNEINSRSESILKLTTLIADSRVSGAVETVLDTIINCYKSVDHILCASDATQVLSSTRGLLYMLHQTLHEHLRACYGVQGARLIPSNFSEESFSSWTLSIRTSPHHSVSSVNGMTTLIISIASHLESSLKGDPPLHRRSSMTYDPIGDDPSSLLLKPLPVLVRKAMLSELKSLVQCKALDDFPMVWRFQMDFEIPDLRIELGNLMTPELEFACCHWISLLPRLESQRSEVIEALSCSVPALCHWVAMMGILGKTAKACQGLKELQQWLESDTQGLDLSYVARDLYRLATQFKGALAVSSLSILGAAQSFIPSSNALNAVIPRNGPIECRIVSRDVDSNQSWPPQVLKIWASGILSLAFSPNGSHLASTSLDGTFRIWHVVTGAALRELEGHTGVVRSVTYSSDGRHLASASDDRTVRIWNAATGAPLRELKGHTDCVLCVAFSPNGSYLGSGSSDHAIRIWDASTGTSLRVLRGHADWVRSVAYSPNGRLLASASNDHTVRVWNVATGENIRVLDGHTNWVFSIAFSPDGHYLASNDGNAHVWHVATGQLLRTLEGGTGPILSVKFSSDNLYLTSVSRDRALRVWDIGTGEIHRDLKGHTDFVGFAEFSPDGRHLSTALNDGTAVVWWDAATDVPNRGLKGHAELVLSVEFSPDGRQLVSASQDAIVCLWDIADGSCIEQRQFDPAFDLRQLAFSADGSTICVEGLRARKYLGVPNLEDISPPVSPSLSPSAPPSFYLDRHAVCVRRGNLTLRVCWLPDYFMPSSRIAQYGNRVCIGGGEGMIAFINLDGLVLPDV